MPSGYLIPHHYPTFFSIPDRTWSSFESDLAMGSPKDQVLPNYLGKPDTSGKADIPGYPWFQVYQPWHGMPCIRLQTHLAHFLQKRDNTLNSPIYTTLSALIIDLIPSWVSTYPIFMSLAPDPHTSNANTITLVHTPLICKSTHPSLNSPSFPQPYS